MLETGEPAGLTLFKVKQINMLYHQKHCGLWGVLSKKRLLTRSSDFPEISLCQTTTYFYTLEFSLNSVNKMTFGRAGNSQEIQLFCTKDKVSSLLHTNWGDPKETIIRPALWPCLTRRPKRVNSVATCLWVFSEGLQDVQEFGKPSPPNAPALH